MFKSRRTSLPYMSNHSERFTISSILKPVPFCTCPILGGRQWHIKGTEWTEGTHNPYEEGVLEPWRCHGNYITQTNLQLILLVSLNSLRMLLSLTAFPRADHPTASSWYLSTGTRRPGLMSDFVLEWPVLTEECHDTSWRTNSLHGSYAQQLYSDEYARYVRQPWGKANGKLYFAFDYKCDCQTKSACLTYYSKTPTLLP